MKKSFCTWMLLTVSLLIFSQGNSGLGFNYQAIVRGADGFVVPSASVELRFSLMPGQMATQASWVETHNVTTDVYGTVGVTVGKGTKVGGIAATFADVNFAAVYYWLKVEIKESGNYRELSYSALASVPYAEAATNAVGAPIGSIMPFAGDASKKPKGWLLCDGSAVSRSEYENLYNVIGTAWGSGNNSTTYFNLPDLRGVFLRGVSGNSEKDTDVAGRMPIKDGGNSGNNVGSYQDDAIRNITGRFKTSWHSGLTDGSFLADSQTDKAYWESGTSEKEFIISFDASRVVQTGADNRPKNVAVNYIIKY
jgi:microcystin-dependent protein